MNKNLARMVCALAFGLFSAFSVQAQTVDLNNTTSSNATNIASSGSNNAGNAQAITFNSDSSGKQTLRSAPAVGGQGFYGSFSADSCMVSGGGGGSVVGFGINMAMPVEDAHCNLRRNFERIMQASATTKDPARSRALETAAVDIMCQSDEKTAAALRGQGLCSQQIQAVMDGQATTAAVRPQYQSTARPNWEDLYTPG